MNSKIEIINEYIEKCEKCTNLDAKKLSEEIIAVYGNEIKGITKNLHSYTLKPRNMPTNYLGDIRLLKAHLINHKANLENNLSFIEGVTSQIFNIHQTQKTDVSITITLEQTINLIESIPDEKLSPDEKEQLEGKLSKLGTEKEKSKVWDKTQSVLKWIADKGVEVGIAVLPYIVEMLKNAK